MTPKLVSWTNSWLLDPSNVLDYPSEIDRAVVYMAAVTAIGLGSGRDIIQSIHAYFTYLLRGCNPVTADVKRSSFERPEGIHEYFTPPFVETVKRLLNFDAEVSASSVFSLLTVHDQLIKNKKATQVDFLEEQEALIILSMWLLNRKLPAEHPNDPVLVRACLSLYKRAKEIGIDTTVNQEYIRNDTLQYSNWVSDQVRHLLIMTRNLEELTDRLSYTVWFASLIRASRMYSASGLKHRLGDLNELNRLLQSHVEKMVEYLNTLPLRDMQTTASKRPLLNVLGIKPRRKAE